MKKRIIIGVIVIAVISVIVLYIFFSKHDIGLDDLYKNKISSYLEVGDYTIDEYEEHVSVVTYNGSDEEVKIPEQLNGKPVYTIEDSAFYGNLNVKKIVIPKHVIRVGHQAFIGCLELKEITIPDSMLEFGEHALDNCPKLEIINVDKNSDIGKKLTDYGYGKYIKK